jgi:hypothetical protein
LETPLLKLGIYRRDQYHAACASERGANWRSFLRLQFSGRTRVSYQLLRTSIPPSPEEVSLFDWINRQLQLSNGVFRTTWHERFRPLDKFLNNILLACFESSASLDIQDWAASDCLASSEWYSSLKLLFPHSRFTASDLVLFLLEVRLPGGDVFVLEPSGEPLQYVRPPFVVRLNPPEPGFLVVNRLLQALAQRKYQRFSPNWKIPLQWLASEVEEDIRGDGLTFGKIPVVHPEAEAIRRASNSFEIRRQSVFEPLPQPCHVIRAMNIFNRGCFRKEQLLDGVQAAWKSLLPGGIWIVGRTLGEHTPVHQASVFVKEFERFRLLHRYGHGSEIEDLAVGIRANDPARGHINSLRLESVALPR